MKARTFKEIRDFCLTDGEYRAYYDVPEQSKCTREQWEHFYADRGDGTTYRGTVLYGRSQERLVQFLGQEPPHILLILDIRTFEAVDENPNNGLGLTVSAKVEGSGVEIGFSEPFIGPYHHPRCRFVPVSDRLFSAEGVAAEVQAYCNEHILLPPGRYRDMQIEQRWPKRSFVELYNIHKKMLSLEDERQHRKMLDRYAHARFITESQAYRHLDAEGIFDGLNCDEDERLLMAGQFAENYNREHYKETMKHQKN